MALIVSDQNMQFSQILEGFDCPAILVSIDYDILATNHHCESAFGELSPDKTHRCFEFSHRYKVPCDQAGEDCPLGTAKHSAHKEHVLHIHQTPWEKEHVLHIHQTPWEKEHVDLEMLPIHDQGGILIYCVELLHRVPLASGDLSSHELIGESALFKKMLNKVSRVGKSDAAVLLLSESGTGKELAARTVHMASSRKDNPMVAL